VWQRSNAIQSHGVSGFTYRVVAIPKRMVSGKRRMSTLRHTDFKIHSKVRTTSIETARMVARYMAKPIPTLKHLSFDEAWGKVTYRYGKTDQDKAVMDYADFIARVATHIPDRGEVMLRYYDPCNNAHRGKERKRGQAARGMRIVTPRPPIRAAPGWRELIR
jgi:hypothetical protein